MIKMVTDKKSGLEKPDFFNSKTILNLLYFSILRRVRVVFDPTNIQILKQFTTVVNSIASGNGCFRPYKYTNFKAIHNVRQCFT